MSIAADTQIKDRSPQIKDQLNNADFELPFKDYSRGDPGNDIVISGIAGRYPECDDLGEFWKSLLAGVELVSIDDRRWPVGKFLPVCVTHES